MFFNKTTFKKVLAIVCTLTLMFGIFSISGFSVNADEPTVNVTCYKQTYNFGGKDLMRNLFVGDDGNAYYCINPKHTVGNDAYILKDSVSNYTSDRIKSDRSDISNEMIRHITYWGSVYGGMNPDAIVCWGMTVAVHKYPVQSWVKSEPRASYNASSVNPIADILASGYSDKAKILAIAEFLTNKASASINSGYELSGPCSIKIQKISNGYIDGSNYVIGKYFVSGTYTSFNVVNNSSTNVNITTDGNTITASVPLTDTSYDVNIEVDATRMGYDTCWYQSKNHASTYQDIVRMVQKNTYASDVFTETQNDNTGSLKLYKRDADTDVLISGVGFRLTHTESGNYYDFTTNSSGFGYISGLPFGHYTLLETSPAPGYEGHNNSWNNLVIDNNNREISFTAYNGAQSRAIGITKEDTETGGTVQYEASLDGAVYEVYDSTKTILLDTVALNGNVGTSCYLPVDKTYYLKEKVAPKGYNLDPEYHAVEITHGNSMFIYLPAKQVTVSDSVIKGKISITKYANIPLGEYSERIVPLKDAEFTVYDKNDTLIVTIKTDENGKCSTDNLPYGEYRVVETSVPDGYLAVEEFKVFISENDKEYHYNLTDKAILKGITIKKTDTDGNTVEKAGAKFEVYSVTTGEKIIIDGNSTFETDESGMVVVPSTLTYGNYYIKEVAAPEGYVLSNSVVNFKIDGSSEENEVIPFVNRIIKGSLKVLKVDENGNPVNNFGIELYDKDKNLLDTKASETNEIVFDNLVYGEYFYKEKTAPAGYIINLDYHSVSITEDGVAVEKALSNKQIKGNIRILKTDDNNNPLKDVVISLYKSDNTFIADKTTGVDGIALFEDVVYGDYYYVEKSAPAMYVLDSTHYAVSVINDSITIDKTFKNNTVKGNLKITKTDEDGNPLGNANIAIYDFNDVLIEEKTTGDNGVILFENIPYGSYYYKETSAPVGFVLDSSKNNFNIATNNELIERTIVNEKIKSSIEITKTDKYSNPLSGCKISLYREDNALVDSLITGIDGKAKFENVVYGNYYYKEEIAPIGYILDNNKYDVSVLINGEEIVKNIQNEKIKINISVLKTDENGVPLAGCTIGLYGSDDTLISSLVTDLNGAAKFTDVEYGTYYVKEIEAAEGYLINNNAFDILPSETDVSITIVNDIIKGSLKILKVNDADTPLSGCAISLFNNKDVLIGTVTTGDDGIALFENLKYGDYYYVETSAPLGYVLNNEKHNIKIKDNNVTIEEKLINSEIKGVLQIKKVDNLGNPVKGCKFIVYNKEDTPVAFLITGDDGLARLSEIPYGGYYFKEVEVPEYYILNEDIFEFSIENNDETVVKEVVNTKKEEMKAPKMGDIDYHSVKFFDMFMLLIICFTLFKRKLYN